jgi:hypothetical protein
MTYWKWYNAVLLLASRELPIDLVPPNQCGESCMTLVCILFTSEISNLCSQMITLHTKNSVTGSCTTKSSAQKFYSQMKLSQQRWNNKHTKFTHLISSEGKFSYNHRNAFPDLLLSELLV